MLDSLTNRLIEKLTQRLTDWQTDWLTADVVRDFIERCSLEHDIIPRKSAMSQSKIYTWTEKYITRLNDSTNKFQHFIGYIVSYIQ